MQALHNRIPTQQLLITALTNPSAQFSTGDKFCYCNIRPFRELIQTHIHTHNLAASHFSMRNHRYFANIYLHNIWLRKFCLALCIQKQLTANKSKYTHTYMKLTTRWGSLPLIHMHVLCGMCVCVCYLIFLCFYLCLFVGHHCFRSHQYFDQNL